MAATYISPMAILNTKTKTTITKSQNKTFVAKQNPAKPISQISIQNNVVPKKTKSISPAETAIAGAAVFATSSVTGPAMAAGAEGTTDALSVSGLRLMEQIGLIGDAASAVASTSSNDNRGTLLLLVVSPAILWVLYNILQPALNQLNRMRSK